VLATALSVLIFTGSVLHAARDEDPRIRQAREEFETAKEVLAGVTNETEMALWEKRVYLAEKELENSERLVALEEREKRFSTKRKIRVDQDLREALSQIETISRELENITVARRNRIRRLNEHRAHLESEEFPDTDEGVAAAADRDAAIRNSDAEILALMLQSDTVDLQARVMEEAARIGAFLVALDANPPPTIRLIMEKGQNASAVSKNREEFRLHREDLVARLEETSTAIDLTEERAAGIEESAAIMQDRFNVERRSLAEVDREKRKERERRWRRILDRFKSESTLMEDRLEHLRAQQGALTESLNIARQGLQLLEAESAFLEHDAATLRGRYMRQTLVPICIILLLILAYSFVSRRIFPRFLPEESLFVTRRMGGYVLLFVIILMLIAFFLEDLRGIAVMMGIFGAAIVIALQDLCSSFAGWFVIVTCRKMKLGDRVEIDGRRGDIIDIQMLRTTLLELNNWLGVDEPTGRVVVIPNSFIFKSHVFNYSHVHPYIWGKVDVTVTFESPAVESREMLLRILEEETREEFDMATHGEGRLQTNYGLRRTEYKPRIHTYIADSGVHFSLFYVSHYRTFCLTRDKISSRVVDEVDKHPTINFAYPTERHIPTPESEAFPVTVTKNS